MNNFSNESRSHDLIEESNNFYIVGRTRLWAATSFSLSICASILALLFFASFPRKTTVNGEVITASGTIIYPAPQSGTISALYVQHGSRVHPGDRILLINSDVTNETKAQLRSDNIQHIKNQIESLNLEKTDKKASYNILSRIIEQKQASTRSEYDIACREIEQQEELTKLARQDARRYEKLYKEQVVSLDELESKRQTVLNALNAVTDARRRAIDLSVQGQNLAQEAHTEAVKNTQDTLELNQQIDQLIVEQNEQQIKRGVLVVSKSYGTVSDIDVNVGKQVSEGEPLFSTVGEKKALLARIYIPSSSIGFIHTGDEVLLRVDAFPYEKFGLISGRIINVSEDSQPVSYSTIARNFDLGTHESLYTAEVSLDSDIFENRVHHELSSGMLLTADVLEERKKLYEWILGPVLSSSSIRFIKS